MVDRPSEQRGVMTNVAIAHRSSGAPSARATAQDEAKLGPRSHATVAFPVDDDDLDDLRTAKGICLWLVVGLASWIVIGFVAWPLLA